MIQKIKSRLRKLANAVKNKIKQEVHTVVELLKERVREIKMKLEGIAASLEEYVKELGAWMGEAKKYIKDVKWYVNHIMQQLDGKHRQAIDKAAADIDSELGKKVEELNQWIKDAENAVNVAKEKAEDVFKRLDKDSGPKISEGLHKIEAARSKVESVSSKLKTVHSGLDTWKNAAEDVLSKAAGKAEEVSEQLDPSQHGDGNPIGEKLNTIENAEKAISSANLELKSQVDKLSKWITEADGLRQKAQEKAEEVYQSLAVHKELSNKNGEIKAANQDIMNVNSGLGYVDSKLGEWNKEAANVIQEVIKKANDVYEKLNHGDEKQPISQHIKQITEASKNVVKVDEGLKLVNDDLKKWREAATLVLTTAIDKASEVHTALDPTKNSSTLGNQIHAIDTARQGIVDANKELERQVKRLNKWIESAEKIRHKAETKAREAYDKLDVHEELSKNVKKIVDAKDKINEVHNAVATKVKELETWNDRAKEVIQGAVEKAKQVHDALKDEGIISKSVKHTEAENASMIEANKNLATEVQNLDKWKDAAGKVIKKANEKCDEILKRVQTDPNGQSDTIYKQATLLKNNGRKLLAAAQDAKRNVEQRVKDALEAVKAMDSDLRKDLKKVKDDIMKGIKDVIKSLKVAQLGEKVNEDLKELRRRIEGLKENGKLDGIVSGQFGRLKEQKKSVDQQTIQIKEKKLKEMDQHFKSAIKDPLDGKIKGVDEAIAKLYEKFNPNGSASETDEKQLHKIFEHINNEVEKIKGNAGSSASDPNAKGLDGIASKVRCLALAFVNKRPHGFSQRVDGWMGSILGTNANNDKAMQAVTSWIDVYNGGARKVDDALKIVKDQIMHALSDQIDTGQRVITQQDVEVKIVHNLTKVKQACKVFVEELDKKLTDKEITQFANPIVNAIQGRFDGPRRSAGTANVNLTAAVKAALIALCSCVRQVAAEVDYLGISMFGTIIDQIKPTVDELQRNLKAATNAATPGKATLETGTAQAVDTAIENVRDDVKGLDTKFNDVKNPVEDAVSQLDTAVEAYDKQAREQVKAAAKGAITAAANMISADGGSDIELGSKMPNFSREHTKIQTQLPNNLRNLLDMHIGSDEIPFVGKAERVKLSKNFEKYLKQISVGVLTKHPHGALAEAIDKIGGEGMKGLSKHIGKYADERIRDNTFIHPIYEIGQQLEEITDLVNNEGKGFMGEGYTPTSKGVKTLLTDLTKALGDGKLDGINKGLAEIQTVIEKLQKDTFGLKAEAISKAVEEMRKEVEELKRKLKSEHDNDDVINALKELKDSGMASGIWKGNGGSPVNGLKKIESELRKQNGELGKQTNEIRKALDYALRELKGMLGLVGLRLHNIFVPDDVIDNLKKLKLKFRGEKKAGFEHIYKTIQRLQEGNFKHKPETIEKAKKAIEEELKTLQQDLQGSSGKNDGVIHTLRDLIENGLEGGEDWIVVGKKKKGFQKIQDDLQRQQHVLNQQPKDIDSGVKEIINELEDLRNVLQGQDSGTAQERGVMRNFDFLIKEIGDSDDAGLRQIRNAMKNLNTKTVPIVIVKLNELCNDVANDARQVDWKLTVLRDDEIGKKLKNIETCLTNLRLKDLAAAIKMCDDFLIKADDIEKNTVNALWKHVEYEVGDAIEDLTKEARGLYVDSVKDALELFARKVNEELEDLPGDINQDMTIGFKGFMNTVEGENSGNINKLNCVERKELKHLSAAFASFFGTVNDYVRKEITRLHDEHNKEKNPSLPPTDEPYTPKLNDAYDALTELLAYLRDNDGGTDRLTELVERLTKALSNLVPSDFKHPSTPLLHTIANGLSKFAGEFGNCYISAYSGQRCREEHAHKYAKVLLSMVPMMYKALSKLATKCAGEWKHLHVSMFTADDRDNALGNYLTRCGYRVSSGDSRQDGELNNMFTGAGIYEILTTPIPDVAVKMHLDGELVTDGINFIHITSFLYNVLCRYFQACHLYVAPAPRYPCTVRDMLSWLSGLQYTPVADKLPGHCKALLNRRCHEGDTPNRDDTVMAKCIGELPYTIASTCSRSTALLTAIQGNGHGFDLAAYPYSVDFSNSRARLHYPADPAELLEMLREIACRLCKVLFFLYSQCCRSTTRVKGWRECTYGRQVQSHHWQCRHIGTYSSTISTTTATTTSSTTTHGCPPASPLQSFLSDSCHGLLPHTLTTADMIIECANCTANQPGQQCLTPLGFWDLGFAASISGTGWALAKRLGNMCRDADSCLFVLCRTLFCLCPAAPSSLDDVFAFYAHVLRKWDTHDRVRNRGGTYTDASVFISHLNTDGIDSLFPLCTELHGNYENHKLTTAIVSLAGHDHKSHDSLSTLFNDSTCKPPSNCAPYLQPLGLHDNHTYPQKHAGLYITWIMHLAWQFWELLTHLLQSLDNVDCTASGCATCPCQPGTHGGKDTCQCPSIVQCAGILPTLYRYGVTYRNANLLAIHNRAIRCSDLNAKLREALHSGHFTELFRQIDQLIWHIRMPFVYFLIALWSLIALYILHTFLYRMDVLHITSHLLTTRVSHLIDVKALLIPSRNMLSLYNASYFDDDPSELLDAT